MATTTSAPKTVQHGLYYGFSRPELDLEMAKYKAAVQSRSAMQRAAGGGVVNFASINGKQLTYAFPGGVHSLEAWQHELRNAYAQLDGEYALYVDRAVVRFASLATTSS